AALREHLADRRRHDDDTDRACAWRDDVHVRAGSPERLNAVLPPARLQSDLQRLERGYARVSQGDPRQCAERADGRYGDAAGEFGGAAAVKGRPIVVVY